MFATWKIGNKEFKLALTTGEIIRLERQFGGNLLNQFMQAGQGELPPLNYMLAVIHGAMQKFEHGYELDDVIALYDDYLTEGGNQTELLKIVMEVFKESGLIPKGKKKDLKKVQPA